MKYKKLTKHERDTHPSIHCTGSVRGMKERGLWDKDAECVRRGNHIYNLSVTIQTEHYDFLMVKPAVGAYCITFLLIIGIAMNLTVIIRTAREKRQEQKTEELK